jgi:ATP-dependent helicase/nuclease subunit A
MGSGTLTIFSASAGSGKTYKLTGIYLVKLFSSKFYFRKILAVTFTNKATAEMKSRILDQLFNLATNAPSGYLPDLIKTTCKTEIIIRREAKEILDSILNDFSRFSVSTIDSFFQKILRAFARDIGLHSGFNVEIDHSTILSAAIDKMIEDASTNLNLRNWLIDYAKTNIEDGKTWNLKTEITKLAGELFKEDFKLLSPAERLKLESKESLSSYIREIASISSTFEKQLIVYGIKCEEIFTFYSLSDEMFYQKGKGVPSFIKALVKGEIKTPNQYVREILNEPPRWCTGALSPELQSAIGGGLEACLKDAISYFDNNIGNYKTANAIRSNIFALGILSDVLHNIHLITSEENSFLLSDAGEFLYLITAKDQTPFIYEKVGNRFENFMIDEFQDTSLIQWNNFKPLIENSMANGFDNIVVGDVKQSIYRWRNSDWRILGQVLNKQVDNVRFINEPLKTNWRSCSNIIKFNNTLFSVIPKNLDEDYEEGKLPVSFKELFSEAVQNDPGKKKNGYVKLEFIEDSDEFNWKSIVLQRLPSVIEKFQDSGYRASEIGILVRDNKEGSTVLKTLIDYGNSCSSSQKTKYNYNIVSNDSLLLSQSYVISFVISVLSVLANEDDMISRARMLRYYLLSTGYKDADKVPLVSNILIEESARFFPDGIEEFLADIKQLPLFELTESIIMFFHLGDYSWNVAYLNTFQDQVLVFSGNKSADIQSYLDWWETDGKRKSVVLPEHQDAMKVLTIHKSKGLEFKVVIIPFISWNLDHKPHQHTILWVRPTIEPFDKLGIVPVKYRKELEETIFADYYKEEKYSAILDNLNLLYVAMTRSIDALYGFLPDKPRAENGIATLIKNAISYKSIIPKVSDLCLNAYYYPEKYFFEYGEIPEYSSDLSEGKTITSMNYIVTRNVESLKLKLHGENYFTPGNISVKERINYGKLMHEVFENIISSEDIPAAIRKLVIEGKIEENESVAFEHRIDSLVNSNRVKEWFSQGNKVMTETGILMPSGVLKRPDRVIFKDGKTIIIDFKFGAENSHYIDQIGQYRNLISQMGFVDIEAYIWYVDKNKIIPA